MTTLRAASTLLGAVVLVLSHADSAAQAQGAVVAGPHGIAVSAGHDVIISGLTPDEFRKIQSGDRAAIGRLAQQLGAEDGAIQGFFAQLGQANIQPNQYYAKFAEIARSFIEKRQQLEATPTRGPEESSLKAQADAALRAGQFDDADRLIAQLIDLDSRSVAGPVESLAILAYQSGDVAMSQRRYRDAADRYGQSAAFERDPQKKIADLMQRETALREQGELGDVSALKAAIVADDEILSMIDDHFDRDQWAAAQNNLGVVQQLLGARQGDNMLLEKSVESLNAALSLMTIKHNPRERARTQRNLGWTLLRLGELEDHAPVRFRAAIDALQQSLHGWTQQDAKDEEAATQADLCGAFLRLGETENGTEKLERSRDACLAALKLGEWTQTSAPVAWANVQNTLGGALFQIGKRERGRVNLDAAMKVYDKVLLVWTQGKYPLNWANTMENMALIEEVLADRVPSRLRRETLEHALGRIMDAETIYRELQGQSDINKAETTRARLEAKLAT